MTMEALQELTIYELVGRIACIVVAISGVIQFTPIKLNPWSWLGKKIGKALTGDLLEAVNGIRAEVNHDPISVSVLAPTVSLITRNDAPNALPE